MVEFCFEVDGKLIEFQMNTKACKRFSDFGGSTDLAFTNPVRFLEVFIRAFQKGVGLVSVQAAEKLADKMIEEYDLMDMLNVFISKYSEVFTGGETESKKKILTEIDPSLAPKMN